MANKWRIKRHSKKAGLPPGTLLYTGESNLESPRITVMDYDESGFQEKQVDKVEDCFDFKGTPTVTWINIDGLHEPVRERIRTGKGKVRKMGSDYLMYTLLDAVVDNYFGILEKFGERMEAIEEELTRDPTEKTLRSIHNMKREVIFLRKSVWPLRELINGIQRSESPFITETTEVYLRDVYDHTIQVIDTVEGYRDMLSGMTDLYLSSVSNRMNSVIKVLTIIATIFIPLTFIAGVYGMNFENMPELEWRYGYLGVWIVMITVFVGMIVYFKKKDWL